MDLRRDLSLESTAPLNARPRSIRARPEKELATCCKGPEYVTLEFFSDPGREWANVFTQTSLALRIDAPLGPDAPLRSFSGQEAISQLFRFQLELLSENDSIAFDSIVGWNVVHSQILDSERGFNGFTAIFRKAAATRT